MKYFFMMQYQTWRKRWVRVHVWRNRRRRVLLEVVHIFLIKVVDEYWEVVVPTFLEIFVYKMKISLFTFYFLAISRRRHRSISGFFYRTDNWINDLPIVIFSFLFLLRSPALCTKDLTFFFSDKLLFICCFFKKKLDRKKLQISIFRLRTFFLCN
jgi:hypothetical protein